VSYLSLKRRRDLRRRKWQFGAVALIVFLGVMMFASSYDAYRNLDASYRGTYERLAFADMTVIAAPAGFSDSAASVSGVAAAIDRRQADLPLRVGQHTFLGRMVGLPAGGQPQVDRIDITEGEFPAAGSSVGDTPSTGDSSSGASTGGGAVPAAVEIHMAEHFELVPGDPLEYFDGSGWRELSVSGIAVSPEYIWPARSSQEIFAPADSFGVVFVPDAALDDVSDFYVEHQVLVLYEDGADREATDTRVAEAAHAAGAAAAITQADHPSNKTLQLDVLGFEQMAVAFPVMFLLAAGMAVYTLMTRLVYQERHLIGTLRANGLSRRAVVRHYLSYGVFLGVVAATAGVIVGVPLGWSTTYIYTQELGIPDTVRELHWVTVVIGVLFGLVAGTLAVWVPARAAASVDPAEAMRGFEPRRRGGRSLLERLVPPLARLPVRWRMVLRGIGRNRRRSLSTVIGVVLALVLILASWGLIDTFQLLLTNQFEKTELQDATAVMRVPVSDEVVASVGGVEGVDTAERVTLLAVSVRGPDATYATQLSGFEAATQMHGFPNGMLESGGVILGSALQDMLGVDPGDDVVLAFSDLGTQVTVPVAGFVDESLGTFAYLEQNTLEGLLSAGDPPVGVDRLQSPGSAVVMVRVAEGIDRAAVISRLETLDVTGSVSDARYLYDTAQQYMGLFWVFIGMMLVFGGLLAFALIFNIMSVNLAERSGELAIMRANGFSRRGVASLVVGESLLLTCVAIPFGLVAGWWAAGALLDTYSSDLFLLELAVRPRTYILSALAMIVVTLLSLWPGIRAAGRMDLGRVVRERSL
jgi:putative ABC transport system permease protein